MAHTYHTVMEQENLNEWMIKENAAIKQKSFKMMPITKLIWFQKFLGTTIGFSILTIDAIFLIYKFNFPWIGYIALCFFAGHLLADFQAGLVHWFADTYFLTTTPIVGYNFVLAFRIHHIKPTAFTYNTFVATFGDTAWFALPQMVSSLYLVLNYKEDMFSYLLIAFLFFSANSGMWENKIHQWAHSHGKPIPWLVTLLRKSRLLLRKSQHHRHHTGSHLKCYCSVSGLMNYPLDAFDFWRKVEQLIQATTGIEPRVEDEKSEQYILDYLNSLK